MLETISSYILHKNIGILYYSIPPRETQNDSLERLSSGNMCTYNRCHSISAAVCLRNFRFLLGNIRATFKNFIDSKHFFGNSILKTLDFMNKNQPKNNLVVLNKNKHQKINK